MRTVKWLKEELSKFPDDALCYAYEGEVTGLIIIKRDDVPLADGVIHCSYGNDEPKQTKLLPEDR